MQLRTGQDCSRSGHPITQPITVEKGIERKYPMNCHPLVRSAVTRVTHDTAVVRPIGTSEVLGDIFMRELSLAITSCGPEGFLCRMPDGDWY